MVKVISLAFLAAGIVVLIFGINAKNSFASHVSNTVNGNPTDNAMWLIGLGIVGIILGLGGLLLGSRNRG